MLPKSLLAAGVLWLARRRRGGGDVQFSTDVSGAVLGMTPFEFGCTAIPALSIVAIVVVELRRLLRRRLADSTDEAADQTR